MKRTRTLWYKPLLQPRTRGSCASAIALQLVALEGLHNNSTRIRRSITENEEQGLSSQWGSSANVSMAKLLHTIHTNLSNQGTNRSRRYDPVLIISLPNLSNDPENMETDLDLTWPVKTDVGRHFAAIAGLETGPSSQCICWTFIPCVQHYSAEVQKWDTCKAV